MNLGCLRCNFQGQSAYNSFHSYYLANHNADFHYYSGTAEASSECLSVAQRCAPRLDWYSAAQENSFHLSKQRWSWRTIFGQRCRREMSFRLVLFEDWSGRRFGGEAPGWDYPDYPELLFFEGMMLDYLWLGAGMMLWYPSLPALHHSRYPHHRDC